MPKATNYIPDMIFYNEKVIAVAFILGFKKVASYGIYQIENLQVGSRGC